jgi:phage host-nuclease inhibitor protein Gam
MNAAISIGSSILGAIFGRKLASAANMGRAATGMRAAGRIAGARQDIAQASESVEALAQRLADLEAEFTTESEKVAEQYEGNSLELTEVQVTPKKTDIVVGQVMLVWQPWLVKSDGTAEAAV